MHSRARITAGELVVVCSHYDLGVIEEVRRFRGGSRLAPKVLIKTGTGEYLLKRRAPGPANAPTKVAFTHEVILHLESLGFPVPAIIGTKGRAPAERTGGNSMLQLGPASPGGGGVYEVFRFVRGERYDRSPEEARAAGWWLAQCHRFLADFKPLFPAPRRTFHNHPQVPERLASIAATFEDSGVRTVCRALSDAYVHASARVAEFAGAEQSEQIVHGDWHPGNMLFARGGTALPSGGDRALTHDGGLSSPPEGSGTVAAVFDFDSARLGQPLHDLANGALQFSVLRRMGEGDESAGSWRIGLTPELFGAFVAGYYATGREGAGEPDAGAGAAGAIPWLMIEALIVEAGAPIAATGKFGKLDAKPVLEAVRGAVDSIAAGADRLAALAAG